MRTALIAGNWKMYKTIPEAVDLALSLKEGLGDLDNREVLVAPPFVAIPAVVAALQGSPILTAAQDVFWEEEGAFTGQVSPRMLLAAGCAAAIIGHSERRQFFGETDETVNKKVAAALGSGLRAIMCLGETLAQRDAGETLKVVERQLEGGLKDIDLPSAEALCVAYEPIWAIGTGRTASVEQAQEVHESLRIKLADIFGPAVADKLRILYGGSVKPGNIRELMAAPDIDGALVGGASLTADSFLGIVKF